MKSMKKLIPALAMLLVSLIVMSSASFAWFSMNKTVTATGMSVTATVPRQLLISADNSTWGSTMALSSDVSTAAAIVPVTVYESTVGGTLTPTFYRLTTAGMSLVNEAGKNGLHYTAADIAEIQVDDNTTGSEEKAFETTTVDHYQDDIYLRLSGDLPAAADDKKVTAVARITNKTTAGDPLDVITNALHIVLVDEAGKVLVNKDCGNTNNAISVDSGKTYATINLGEVFDFDAANKDSQQLTLYAYYYGEDENCFNNNAADVKGLKIDLEFKLGA